MDYKIITLILWTIVFCFTIYIDYLVKKSTKNKVNDNVKDVYDEDTYNKWLSYTNEKLRLSTYNTIIHFLVFIVLIVFNVFSLVSKNIENNILSGLVVIIFFQVIDLVISFPFDYINTMKIEGKYGFNKTTIKTFIGDTIRDCILQIMLLSFLLICFILIYENLGDWILLVFTGVIVLFVLLMIFIAPVLAKIANKFEPLKEGSLRSKLEDLLNKNGYSVREIKVMDGSRRSTKANAYFSGIGKTKTIVLYDTIIDLMNEDELVAVFAHELGHGKKKHIPKLYAGNIFVIFIVILISWLLLKLPICEDFGYDTGVINYGFLAIILLNVLAPLIMTLTGFITSYLSRKYEYEADNMATTEGYGEHLISGLKHLAKANYSNLTPNPLVVKLTYSHPPLSERIQAITKDIDCQG